MKSASSNCWVPNSSVVALFLLLMTCSRPVLSMDRRFIAFRNEPRITYAGQMASFGNPLTRGATVNIMFPPQNSDPYMCEYPAQYSDASSMNDEELSSRVSRVRGPIALYVPIGRCSAEVKFRNVLQMQRKLAPQIQMLIIYETDVTQYHEYKTFRPDHYPVPAGYNDIGLLYLPYMYANELSRFMNDYLPNESPYFLRSGNERWELYVVISPQTMPGYSKTTYGQEEASATFIWMRFALFTLLIISPCCRAGYLFYAGGGRIHLRRNERGTIIGLQYIPPMPFWLATGQFGNNGETISTALTEEQFNELPEIIYHPVKENEDQGSEGDINDRGDEEEGNTKTTDTETPHIECLGANTNKESTNETENIDEETGEVERSPSIPTGNSADPSPDQTAVQGQKVKDSEDDDEDEVTIGGKAEDVLPSTKTNPTPETLPDAPSPSSTMSTLCSICIDDFEPGEKLVLLPRCQHAFHKECVKPWLLERQGCCPFCKTNVLMDDEETDQGLSSAEETNIEP